ncbi:MAG: hypothetical protein HBSAPP03_10290 [Phycisphaerae bacterium]|nr:MAG: hypothetical protein HBSAPP03_10290 [Phycisphaerae bacterium]
MLIEKVSAGNGGADRGVGGDHRVRLRAQVADLVRERCEGLPPDDAALLRAIFIAGQTKVEIARLSGKPIHIVRARVKTLIRRVTSREFVYVLRARRGWTATRRSVGEACFLHGLSTKAAAGVLRLSPHQVRRHREAIAALCAEARG